MKFLRTNYLLTVIVSLLATMTIAQAQVTGIGPPTLVQSQRLNSQVGLEKQLKVSSFIVPIEIYFNTLTGKDVYTGEKLIPLNSSIKEVVGLEVYVETKSTSNTITNKAPGECLQKYGILAAYNQQYFRISCDETELSKSKKNILVNGNPAVISNNFVIRVTHY
jgi:hypothetical protein